MSLEETLKNDLVSAMKAKDRDKLDVLRAIKAAITNTAIDKKKDNLDETEIVGILQKQAKQRHDSIESFEKAGRKELAEKEKKELEMITAYLPKQLSDEEISVFVKEAISASGAKSKADMGKVMKELMPKVKGKADGKRINQIVNMNLS